jgi:RNA polymerase sigma-70 factor (ECF subfamily)
MPHAPFGGHPHSPAGDTGDAADRAWLEALFRERYAELCRFVYRFVGSKEAAEDVVQDLFVGVWNDRARWREYGTAIVPILYTAARNRAFNALKRRRLEERHAAAPADEPAAADVDAEIREDEVRDAVRRAVAALPERCRLIFTLSRENGMTYAEIAGTLGLSVKTVETQMGRALRSLRSRLAPHISAAASLVLYLLSGLPRP